MFSVLFDEPDTSGLLNEFIAEMNPLPPPPRSDEHDRVIDAAHGMIEVCGQCQYTSEVLYALDPNRYREVALELQAEVDDPDRKASP